MGTPPTFQRGPRQMALPPGGDVEIPAPPVLPRAPEGLSWHNVVLPLGVTTVGMGVMYAATSASQGFNPLYLAATIPMMLASSGISALNSIAQNRAYVRQFGAREESYRATLPALSTTLERQVAE